mgnify:CR=1 FL=1
MTNKENLNNLQLNLCSFDATTQYYYIAQFKKLLYTDGFKYFMEKAGNGATWFYMIIATEILPKLKDDLFFIELKVNDDNSATIKVFRDKGEPILFEKEIEYTDCPPSKVPYEFCIDVYDEQQIICLLQER